jgi:3-methyladenine DNA glycosylase AlkC
MTTPPAKRISDIDPAHLARLNAGLATAKTLTECLAVDFAALMQATLPDLPTQTFHTMAAAQGLGITRRMALAADLVLGHRMADTLQDHPSDTVRGWACFLVAARPQQSLDARLSAIRPLADDLHFGVREWAWLALRPHLAADLDRAIHVLAGWALAPSDRIRRFASEAIRPRGVWSAHITALRQHPERAFPVLEPLRADPSRYVQDSVGNWLNDAAKDQPARVQDLCARWGRESPVAATAYICKRALRSVASQA